MTLILYIRKTFITYTFVNFKINCIVKFYHVVIISTYSIMTISFKIQIFELSNDENYFFQFHVILFDFEIKNDIMTHIMNVNTFVIYVRNVINKLTIIFEHIKFNKISNFKKKNCYHVDSTNVHLIIDVN